MPVGLQAGFKLCRAIKAAAAFELPNCYRIAHTDWKGKGSRQNRALLLQPQEYPGTVTDHQDTSALSRHTDTPNIAFSAKLKERIRERLVKCIAST